jgi:hypothetical protein
MRGWRRSYRSSALPDNYARWFAAYGYSGAVLEVMVRALARLPE